MFEVLPLLPNDPILGLSIAYAQDTNPNKVDLGVGVYKNDAGQTPIVRAVAEAEKLRIARENTKSYTAPAGVAGANDAATKLVFGEGHVAVAENRVRTVQAPGGCGALRVAAELIQRARPGVSVWVSNPTWANHIPLLGSAGLTIREYPYYNYTTHGIDFDAVVRSFKQIPSGDIVLLHACCHNPSGADFSKEQWHTLANIIADRGIIPFVDMAYQGFGEGLDEDAYGLRLLASRVPEMIVSNSFSKNFGLYRERAASLSLVFATPAQADAGLSQVLNVARAIYSMPPAHGATIVDIILHSDDLRTLWENELTEMRERIAGLRHALVNELHALQQERDFSFIANERGMFSFLGLSVEQVARLKKEYSIYMTDTSRISVAGLTHEKMRYVAQSIVAVL